MLPQPAPAHRLTQMTQFTSDTHSLLEFDGSVTDSRMIAEGDSLVHLYVLDIGARIPMCDVIRFRGDKLASMVLYTDSKLFEPDSRHQDPTRVQTP